MYFVPQTITLPSLKISVYSPDVNEGFAKKIITQNLLLEEDKKELNHLSCFSEML